jgi:Spy/CpxP family protein refolding chaperone
VLVVAVSVCPKLMAADEASGAKARRVPVRLGQSIADMQLTDEQATKIADIRKENRPKIAEAAKKVAALVKEEVEKVRAVLTSEQKEKLQAMKDERKEQRVDRLAGRLAHLQQLDLTDAELAQIGEIREEYRPKIENVVKQFSSILTDDQKKAREEALKAGKNRREVWESVSLTSDQKEKIGSACKELVTVVRDELDKIKGVLTEGQQEKLAELKEERRERVRDRMAFAIANFKDLNLTADQQASISEIRKEYRPKVQKAGNKLRSMVREEVTTILHVFEG